MVKRIFLIVFILLTAIFILVLAHREIPQNKLVLWTIQLKPVATKFIEKNIKVFEKKHPETKIIWVDIPIAEAQKRILASILGGNPPDLVNLNPDFSIVLAQKGALEFFNKEDLEVFPSELLEGLKYKNKVFGVPFYATSPVTLVNRECVIGDEYQNIKTYDDILTIKTKCANAFSVNLNENDTFARILNKYGIYDFNSEQSFLRTQKVFDIFKDMYDKNLIPKDSLTINHREVAEKYMAGQTAVVVVGGNFVKMIKENAPDVYEKTEILPQLTGLNDKHDVSLMNFIVPVKSKNKELAKEFLFLLTNKENQLEFAKLTNVLAINKEALKDSFFICEKNVKLTDKARCEGAKQLQSLSYKNFGFNNKKEINDVLNGSIESYILENKNSIKSAGSEIKLLQTVK